MEREPTRCSLVAAVGVTALAAALPQRSASMVGAVSEPAYRTAGVMLQALARRQISSRELVSAAMARIEAPDAKINAS
jgi:hypothetical protein